MCPRLHLSPEFPVPGLSQSNALPHERPEEAVNPDGGVTAATRFMRFGFQLPSPSDHKHGPSQGCCEGLLALRPQLELTITEMSAWDFLPVSALGASKCPPPTPHRSPSSHPCPGKGAALHQGVIWFILRPLHARGHRPPRLPLVRGPDPPEPRAISTPHL